MSDALAPSAGIRLSDEQQLSWLQLYRCENVGPATFLDLIARFGTASAALEALPELAQRSRGREIRMMTRDDAERELDRLHHIGGRLICMGEPDYPPALRAADAPPPVISVKGSSESLLRNAVAFVGSRNASLAGIKLTRLLASEVAQNNFTISSGLARGIDAAAHEASLKCGTVAVFAGGIDHIYPHQNTELANAIPENGGALISEMPFGWKPRAQDFPRRNRIVAGMSLGLVVVEAARRSGSLISARLANEMGRLVFAVPGSPLDPRSEGANHLIKQGAQLITSADEITSALQPVIESPMQTAYSLDEHEVGDFGPEPSETDREKVISAIGHTPTDVDELIRFTGIAPSAVQLIILELSIAGLLERHSGNRVSMI